MVIEKNQPWYVEKRARAYIHSLLPERDITIREESHQDFGVNFVLELRKDEKELGRCIAAQLFAYPEFPSLIDLNKKIARQFPAKLREKMMLPLIAFVVQARELDAKYCWINEPSVEEGSATLHSARAYDWHKLDEKSMEQILARGNAFWDTLLKRAWQT
jgi:hypothetical protein